MSILVPNPQSRPNSLRLLRATFRDWYVLFREFRTPLLLFILISTGVAFVFAEFYVEPETRQRLSLDEAFYAVLTVTVIDYAFPIPRGDGHWLIIFYFLMPLVGLGLASQGIGGFLSLLFNRRARGGKWVDALITTYNRHVVVCGLGHVGSRVVDSLLNAGVEVVGVDMDETSNLVAHVRDRSVPVIFGDIKQAEVLKRAGVPRARAIIICTDSDIANIEAAFLSRDMNKDARLIVRMFDPELAQRMKKVVGIDEAFSASALAAPIFAGAALDVEVHRTFSIGDETLSVGRMTIKEGSAVAGKTIAQVEKDVDCSIFMHKRNGVKDMHPPATLMLQAGDYIMALGDFPTITRLAQACNSRR